MQLMQQTQLPYSFAKRHGVMLQFDGEQAIILLRADAGLPALTEARRLLGEPAQYQTISDEEFNRLLSGAYAGDTGESQQVAAGLEDHPDLLSLADQVPEAEDLMDQEDDAPIIRLINALLSEAIRLGASDIHIETFVINLYIKTKGDIWSLTLPKWSLVPLVNNTIFV